MAGAVVALVVLAVTGCSDDDGDAATDSVPSGDERGEERTAPETTAAPTTTLPEPEADQSPPSQANGITVDGSTVWLADFGDDIVVQVDRETGAILRRISTAGDRADDVALDPDGAVWTSGLVSGDLGRIADGEFASVVPVEEGINGIEVGADGTVYVATGATLYAYDPATQALDVVVEGLPEVNGFGILPDGRILAPGGGLDGPGQAVLIDPTDGTFSVAVEGFPPVAAGTTDADGTPYLLANITGEVLRIDLESGTAETVFTVESGRPFDNLAFAEDGTLYLSSFTEGTLTEVAPDGTERTITVGQA